MPSLFHVQMSAWRSDREPSNRVPVTGSAVSCLYVWVFMCASVNKKEKQKKNTSHFFQRPQRSSRGQYSGTMVHSAPSISRSLAATNPKKKCFFCGATLFFFFFYTQVYSHTHTQNKIKIKRNLPNDKTDSQVQEKKIKQRNKNSSLIFNKCKAAKTALNI